MLSNIDLQTTSPLSAAEFLDALYGEEPPGYLVIWTRQDKLPRVGRASKHREAAQFALELARTKDVYFGLGLQKEKPGKTERGTPSRGESDGVVAIPGLWIEIDIRQPGAHAEVEKLPESIEDVLEFLSQFPLPPTLLIHSGHGMHVYWLFKELWVFDSDGERKEALHLLRRFQATFQSYGRERGWKIDNTSDLARVLRMPGTYNRKLEPKPVQVLDYNENLRYEPDDFDQYLIDLDLQLTTPSNNGAMITGDFPSRPVPIEPILKGCSWLAHCKEDAATLSEPEWYAMLSIVGRCKEGEQIAHEWSKAYPGYSESETQAKLTQALETAGPRTCADIQQLTGASYCEDCEFKGKIKSPINLTLRRNRKELKRIDAGSGDLAATAEQAWEAVKDTNDPPELFKRGGLITRIQLGDNNDPYLAVVSEAGLRGVLARCAYWYRWAGRADDQRMVDALPPIHIVKDMMAAPEIPLPVINRVVEAPVFGEDGSLRLDPGYHEGSRTFFWNTELTVPPIPKVPTRRDVEKAKTLIMDELMGDFPFSGESERTHAIAVLLGPFVRELIQGPTPLHVFEAPSPGTGKSLLADVLCYPAIGRPAATMTEGRDEEEWRKRITAALIAAPTFLLIDNVRRKLDSAALAAALTAQTWQDRILGRSELTTLPVRTVWLATGNNPALTTEMARRTVRIRLDAKVARPWQREGFRHEDLRGWARQNRAELVWSALALVQNWIAHGRPDGKYVLGQYERWAQIMGGIFDCAGISGFLGNLSEVYDAADEETAQWEDFVRAWWDQYRNYPQTSSSLYELAAEKDLLLSVRGDRGEQSQKIRMGHALRQMRDRQIAHWRIMLGDKDRNKSNTYYLVQLEDETPDRTTTAPVDIRDGGGADDYEPF